VSKAGQPQEKIAKLKIQMKELQTFEIQLKESPDKAQPQSRTWSVFNQRRYAGHFVDSLLVSPLIL
jgi:hypothetical protein